MLTPPPPFHLRPMQLADVDAVMAIEVLSFPIPAKTAVYERELTQNQWARYQVLEGAGSKWQVASKDYTLQPVALVGYSGYWVLVDEAHISTIAIHPDWRGQGLGELLLLNMLYLATAEKTQIATLEVRRSNTSAQALYTKYRFEVVGERRRYYRDGEDAVLMTAVLDEAYGRFLEQQKTTLFAHLENNT